MKRGEGVTKVLANVIAYGFLVSITLGLIVIPIWMLKEEFVGSWMTGIGLYLAIAVGAFLLAEILGWAFEKAGLE